MASSVCTYLIGLKRLIEIICRLHCYLACLSSYFLFATLIITDNKGSVFRIIVYPLFERSASDTSAYGLSHFQGTHADVSEQMSSYRIRHSLVKARKWELFDCRLDCARVIISIRNEGDICTKLPHATAWLLNSNLFLFICVFIRRVLEK